MRSRDGLHCERQLCCRCRWVLEAYSTAGNWWCFCPQRAWARVFVCVQLCDGLVPASVCVSQRSVAMPASVPSPPAWLPPSPRFLLTAWPSLGPRAPPSPVTATSTSSRPSRKFSASCVERVLAVFRDPLCLERAVCNEDKMGATRTKWGPRARFPRMRSNNWIHGQHCFECGQQAYWCKIAVVVWCAVTGTSLRLR